MEVMKVETQVDRLVFGTSFMTATPVIQAKEAVPIAQMKADPMTQVTEVKSRFPGTEIPTPMEAEPLTAQVFMRFRGQIWVGRIEVGTTEAQLIDKPRKFFGLGPVRLLVTEREDRMEVHEGQIIILRQGRKISGIV
jgi:hypothetical protein